MVEIAVPKFSWEAVRQKFLGNNGSAFFFGGGGQWFSFIYSEKTPVGKFGCHSNTIFQP
jgi:hypothetical protein